MFSLAPEKRRLQSIDFLRGIASLAIVILHAVTYSEIQPKETWFPYVYHIFELGWLGVPLFFVISGFCIHLQWAKGAKNVADKRNYRINFFSFWKRRFWRLYPPYLVALCGSMLLLLGAYFLGKNVALIELYPDPKLLWMGYDFFFHATMLHGLDPLFDKGGGNPVFWSLAREEYLYLLYFVFLFFRKRFGCLNTNIAVMIISIGSLYIANYFVSTESAYWNIIFTSAIALWFQWTLGILSVESYLKMTALPKFASHPAMIIVWGFLAYYFTYYNPSWFIQNCLWGLCFFTLVNFCIEKEQNVVSGRDPFTDRPVAKFFAGVGIWSYSLYLVHNPIQKVIKQLLGSYAVTENVFMYLLVALVLTIAGFIGGRIFFLAVEKHFIY